jgi:CO/xanthine dehydrogenase FAD-binding subunit
MTIDAIMGSEYQAPVSLLELLDILEQKGGTAKILAGGTDLVLQMRMDQCRPAMVLDIKKIPELNNLEWNARDGLRIGAAVTLSNLLDFIRAKEQFRPLAQACSLIGSVQIRNRATLCGNICNAAPSADSAPPLICLGARAVLASRSGTRSVPLEEFFSGPGRSLLRPDEMLIKIEVPNPPLKSAGSYLRQTTREEMDIAVVGVASLIKAELDGKTVGEARIALGAVAPTPIRARQAEAALIGQILSSEVLEKAAEKASQETCPISDVRGSAEYRSELVKVLTRRTLKEACTSLGLRLK